MGRQGYDGGRISKRGAPSHIAETTRSSCISGVPQTKNLLHIPFYAVRNLSSSYHRPTLTARFGGSCETCAASRAEVLWVLISLTEGVFTQICRVLVYEDPPIEGEKCVQNCQSRSHRPYYSIALALACEVLHG